MNREIAAKYCRELLNEQNLQDWHVRITQDMKYNFLGLCSYKDKCIILSAYHIDIHPEDEVKNTIKHEVAHALTPFHSHDSVWKAKAIELGCTGTALSMCSHLSFNPEIIDAIRSGADVKIEYTTEVIPEQIIQHPKYTVTRLQDKCVFCGKVAIVDKESIIVDPSDTAPDKKIIVLKCGHLQIKNIPKGTPYQNVVTYNWMPEVRDCKHEWIKNHCIKCAQYKGFKFQIEGARFLEAALAQANGGAIFDEMGLGKTIQVLLFLYYNPQYKPLFMVKSGIKYQWVKEIIRILGPGFVPHVLEAGSDILIPGMKSYVCSYDLIVPKVKNVRGKQVTQGLSLDKFKDSGINLIILDECQQIKNPDSSRTQQVRKLIKMLNAKVIALSGTPWKNRGTEFFTVLNMLDAQKFHSYQNYITRWVDTYYHGNVLKYGGIRKPEEFREYIKHIAIRREVTEVAPEMPDVNRTLLYHQLDQIQQTTYDDYESKFVKWYNDVVMGGDDPFSQIGEDNILAKLQKMRHLTGLAKIPATEEFVDEFYEETDRKLVIFTHHLDVMQIIHGKLDEKYGHAIPVLKLSADLTSMERHKMQELFNESPRAFMVASTLAAGEGINLQTCADAVMHERQWNPANEDQAAPGRFRRIGSKFTMVNVTFPTAAGTVDDILAGIVERKRVDFHSAMNRGEMGSWNQVDILKELVDGILKSHKIKHPNKKAS